MVNHSVMMKAMLGIHAIHGLWSVVIMGVIGAGMTQPGSASGAARFTFAMVFSLLMIRVVSGMRADLIMKKKTVLAERAHIDLPHHVAQIPED